MKNMRIMLMVTAVALVLATCRSAAAPTPVSRTLTPTAAPTTPPPVGPKYGGVLRSYVPWEMVEWDVHREPSASWPMHYLANAALSKLVSYEHAREGTCDNPLIPVLAESWKFADVQTLDVTLRPGVKFHNKPPVNGREFTAQDVVWNFNRLQRVAKSGFIVPGLKRLDRVEATGPLSVRFFFNAPFAMAVSMLLASMTGPFMYASEAAGADGTFRDATKTWMGTGPFTFNRWEPGVKTVFDKNPNYFKAGRPYLDGLEIAEVPDEPTRLALLLAGKLDLLLRVSPAGIQQIRGTRPEIRTSGCPYYSGFGAIWMRTDKPPFNDVRVRRALNMALDRQAMINSLFMGEGEILTVVPSIWGTFSLAPKDLSPEVRRYMEYQPAEAKRLLAEAGFPAGLKTGLLTTRAFGSPFNESNEAVTSMWEKIGVKVGITWLEIGRYQETVQQGKYDDMSWSRQTLGTPEDLTLWHSTASRGANLGYVSDPVLDQLIERYGRTLDVTEQATIAREIQRRVVEQAYFVQLPTPLEYAAVLPYVRDFGEMSHMSRVQTLYERIWFDR